MFIYSLRFIFTIFWSFNGSIIDLNDDRKTFVDLSELQLNQVSHFHFFYVSIFHVYFVTASEQDQVSLLVWDQGLNLVSGHGLDSGWFVAPEVGPDHLINLQTETPDCTSTEHLTDKTQKHIWQITTRLNSFEIKLLTPDRKWCHGIMLCYTQRGSCSRIWLAKGKEIIML